MNIKITLCKLLGALIMLSVLGCSTKNGYEAITFPGGESCVANLRIVTASGSIFSRIARRAVLTITGTDMTAMVRQLTLSDSTVTGVISGIPVGKNRLFSVAVYDSLDTLQYSGTATADLPRGSTVNVPINIYRVGGNAVINGSVKEYDAYAEHLIGYWPFDESTGSIAADKSVFGNTGTLVSGAAFSPGKKGNCLQLNGIGSYCSIADDSVFGGMSQLTIEAWVYPNKGLDSLSGDFVPLVNKWCGTGSGYTSFGLVLICGNRLRFSVTESGVSGGKEIKVNSSNALALSEWNHVAVVYNGVSVEFYINGNKSPLQYGNSTGNRCDDYTETGHNFTVNRATEIPLTIGGGCQSFAILSGKIDEVSIYAIALDSVTIHRHALMQY